jgi:hypothetical protein
MAVENNKNILIAQMVDALGKFRIKCHIFGIFYFHCKSGRHF